VNKGDCQCTTVLYFTFMNKGDCQCTTVLYFTFMNKGDCKINSQHVNVNTSDETVCITYLNVAHDIHSNHVSQNTVPDV